MPLTLHGRIVHRFQLPCPEKKRSGKTSNVASVPAAIINSKNSNSPPFKHDQYFVDNHTIHRNNCGFIFIPDGELYSQKEYLLSLPKRLLKRAYDAVRLEHNVFIKRYTMIPSLGNFKIPGSGDDKSLPMEYEMIEIHELELCMVERPERTKKTIRNVVSDGCAESKRNLWTLTQFWRKERLDFQKMKNSRPKFSIIATVDAISPIVALDPSNPFALVEVYDKDNTDITCVVVFHGNQAMLNHAVIHPLDTIEFRDVVYKPWAVHKLFSDREANDSTSSIIIRQLIGRIPSHVFVATKGDSVSWINKNSNISRHESQPESVKNGIPPIITPTNLTTITGKIYNVETLSVYLGRRPATVIHFIDMILLRQSTWRSIQKYKDDDENRDTPSTGIRCRLYLSYFPMSLSLQYSLRKDGIVQAHNVHLVCSKRTSYLDFDADSNISDTNMASYGACLRSNLIVLKHATELTDNEEKNSMEIIKKKKLLNNDSKIAAKASLSKQSNEHFSASTNNESSIANSSKHKLQGQTRFRLDIPPKNSSYNEKKYHLISLSSTFINYGFRRIPKTYIHDIYLEYVKDWENRNFLASSHEIVQKDSPMKHVPRLWIVNILVDREPQNETNGRCGSNYESMNSIPIKPMQRQYVRSPYAEFFDHPFCFNANDYGTNFGNPSCSCHLSIEDRKSTSTRSSVLLDLNEILIASQSHLENHISRLLQTQSTSQTIEPLCRLQKGFHGSIRVPLRKLYANLWKVIHIRKESEGDARKHDIDDCIYFVGGFVSELHETSLSVASIANGACQIPITFHKESCRADINDFILGHFESVMISCFCLGHSMAKNTRNHGDKNEIVSDLRSKVSKSVSLPALNSRANDLLGNCALVLVDGFLFVTAFQINCSMYELHKTNVSSPKEEEGFEEIALHIEECLAAKELPSESFKSVTLMGRLTWCRFCFKINTDGSHTCCRLNISSFESDESKCLESDNSCLQALELTVKVFENTARMVKFNKILDTVRPRVNLDGSQRVLATSFWVLGDSGRTCAMTFGGSEDAIPGSSCWKSSIKVTFSSSSLHFNKLGYIRALCNHDCMDAFFESRCSYEEENQFRNHKTNDDTQSFDFVCGLKLMAEMLHRRPSRVNIFRHGSPPLRSVGALSTIPSTSIPLNTLSDLFELIYQGLREPKISQRIMNQSLVRRISNCHFLNVSFCRVQCYCNRCFCPLVVSSANTKETPARKRQREHTIHEPSFWHLSRPGESSIGTNQISNLESDSSIKAFPQHIQCSNFRCPKNECPKHMFGVKWECSGVVDDGTGQARIYANGDAALTLLGISAEVIQIIEDGVWSMHDGSIKFMRSIPPPKHLRDKIINILARRKRWDVNESAMIDPIKLLSIQDRAVYLLERHCRQSSRPRRHLDFYVRCKPVMQKSNAIPHVLHTTIDNFLEDCRNNKNGSSIIHRGQIASYTVPSLKLELVDCGLSSLGTSFTNRS